MCDFFWGDKTILELIVVYWLYIAQLCEYTKKNPTELYTLNGRTVGYTPPPKKRKKAVKLPENHNKTIPKA